MILTQLYEGVLIDDEMTIRKTGIYPYRCQTTMSFERVISSLISNKDIAIERIKDIDKNNMLKEIYLIIEKLDIKFKSNYGHYRRDTDSRNIYLSEPYLIMDTNGGYDNNHIVFSYITGIKIYDENSVSFIGITGDNFNKFNVLQKENMFNGEEGNKYLNQIIKDSSKILDLDEEIKCNLYLRFQTIINYLLNDEINLSKVRCDYLKEVKNYLSEKGSKFLILASFNEELQDKLKRGY